MQRRVIGPYSFFPKASLYDYQIDVDPDIAEVAGVNYQTVRNALNYLRQQTFVDALVTLKKTATYDLTPINGSHTPKGYTTVVCEEGETATFARPAIVTTGGDDVNFFPKYDGLWFKGSNIVFDLRNVGRLGNVGVMDHVLDGVHFTNSGGRSELWLGGLRSTGLLVQGNAYFLECEVDNLGATFRTARLVRGGVSHTGFMDCCAANHLVIGHTSYDWDSDTDYNSLDIDALTVQYTGSAGTATLSMSKNPGESDRVLTAKEDGVAVSTFTVRNKMPDYVASTNFTVQNVVDWLNSLTDWSATLLDNTRQACTLALAGAGNVSAFTNADVKTAPLTVQTRFDIHGDFFQIGFGDHENYAVFDCHAYDHYSQMVHIRPDTVKDVIIANNTLGSVAISTKNTNLQAAQSHVVLMHNSWAHQTMQVKSDYAGDGYCIVANCAATNFNVEGGSTPNLVFADNHVFTGYTGPSQATGTTIGGDQSTVYTDEANGDFTPAGALASNLVAPRVKYDRTAIERATTDAKGAVAT